LILHLLSSEARKRDERLASVKSIGGDLKTETSYDTQRGDASDELLAVPAFAG
jgi:hypothetical protein